jgi:hypothetical protein
VSSLGEFDLVLKFFHNCLDKFLQLVHMDKLTVNKDKLVLPLDPFVI